MIFPFIVIGKLCWSGENSQYFLERGDGQRWTLDIPAAMASDVDRMLYMHVAIEGGRTGDTKIVVDRIWGVAGDW